MNKEKHTMPALNGLRFLAALAVVCYHYAPLIAGFQKLPDFLQKCAISGRVWLGFFYILSGFVLTHAYIERAPQTAADRQGFWFARVARLYPVYLVAFFMFLPMAYEKYLHHPVGGINGPLIFLSGGVLAIFVVQSWTPLSQAWNGPSWSLSVEAFFYFAFPFVLLPIYRLSWKRLMPALFTLWMAMLALDAAHHRGLISDPAWSAWFMYNPLFWVPLFFIGIALYRCSRAWMRVGSASASLLAASALGVLIALCGELSGNWADSLVHGGAAPIMAATVLAFSHPKSLASRLMGTRLLSKLGSASYVIYILQAPIWHGFRRVGDQLLHRPVAGPVAVWQFLLYLPLLLAISFAVQAIVERPAQQWLLALRRRSARAGERTVGPSTESRTVNIPLAREAQ